LNYSSVNPISGIAEQSAPAGTVLKGQITEHISINEDNNNAVGARAHQQENITAQRKRNTMPASSDLLERIVKNVARAINAVKFP